ncbi:hypothetical protein llap_16777 [Limosa lapponica baueri]|uniref:Uncharacterized protein n=1 Tax=Limosa lapponica baueri TaxID=1758121 RepID=A0A2I0TGJ4_LIMLA|nr:hypothetical protein llap_16777 [Limosa lapponica baueri]
MSGKTIMRMKNHENGFHENEKFNQASAKSCTWDMAIPSTNTDSAFAHSMQEEEQQLYLFCCPVSHLSDTEAPSAPTAKETASPEGNVQ